MRFYRAVSLAFAHLALLAATQQTPACAQAPPTPAWLNGITRVAYTDLYNGARYGDWPDKVIADFGKAGVQMMFSRVHNGADSPGLGWRSAYGDPDPSMQGRDGTREVVALCHKNHIRYVGYLWALQEPATLAIAHPDWRMLNSAGQPIGAFCANSSYRDLVRNRVVELVRDFHVDGIFFDMYMAYADACYCPACKAKFRALTGQEPPVKEDYDSLLWQQWVEFKYRSIEEALLDYNRAIKAANPQAALLINSWNAWVYRNPGNLRSSIRVAEFVDGLLEETGWYDTVDPSFFAGPAHMAFMNWHLAGLCKGKRAFMWGAPSLPGWLPLGYEEPAIRAMTMITNGAVPAHSVPGRDAMALYMKDIAARERWTRGASVYPWCGMVVSEKTERWYGRDDPKGRYVKGVYGAFQAMLERHLPVSLVTDRELERGLRERYRVLFLPNCAAMSDAEIATVRDYVRAGGSVVATYETSMYDEHGRRRPDFGLADVLGAHYLGPVDAQQMNVSGSTADLLIPSTHPWAKDPVIRRTLDVRDVSAPVTEMAQSIPLNSRLLLVAPSNTTRSRLRIKTSLREPTGAMSARSTVAIVESSYGKGKVIYIPFDISWSFFRYGHEYLARMMELALRKVATEAPPVEVAAPTIVEAMPQVQGPPGPGAPDRLIVHLLNDCSSTGRSQNVAGESLYIRREVIPIHDIALTFRDPHYGRFTLVPGNTPLHAVATTSGWKVTVPRLDMHCMVVAEKTPGPRALPPGPRRAAERTAGEPTPTGPELLRDGAFRLRSGDALTCWHLAQPADGTAVMRPTDSGPEGQAAIGVQGTTPWACAESERIPVERGRTYTLQGLARASHGDVMLQVSYWRGNEWLGMTVSEPVTTDGAWQECTAVSEPGKFPTATQVSISGTVRGGYVEASFARFSFRATIPVRSPGQTVVQKGGPRK